MWSIREREKLRRTPRCWPEQLLGWNFREERYEKDNEKANDRGQKVAR